MIKLQKSKNINHFGVLFEPLFKNFGYPFWHTMLIWCNVIKSAPDARYWQVWVIKDRDRIIGVCGLYSLNKKTDELWLGWFGIIPEFRNMSIGSVVLGLMIEHARKVGCKTLYSYVGEKNHKAYRFYKRENFRRVSTVQQYIDIHKTPKNEFESMKDRVVKRDL